MAALITRDIIESYLNCKFKAFLQLEGEAGTKSDYESLLIEVRNDVVENFRRSAGSSNESVVSRELGLSSATLKLGEPILLDVLLRDAELSLSLDGLKRANGSSHLGDFHYQPMLFYGGERVTPNQRQLLEVFAYVLSLVQGTSPHWGVIVLGRQNDTRRIQLQAKSTSTAARILQDIRAIRSKSSSPLPTLNAHCEICEFRERCHKQLVAKDDLSLLRAMSDSEIKKLMKKGIFNTTQLSYTFRARKNFRPIDTKTRSRQHALQALAVREKKIYVLGSPDLPVAATDIYLDMEGDPERNLVYLVGLVIVKNGTFERHSFWADTHDEERRIARECREMILSHEPFNLFAFGGYEAAFFRRMMTVALDPQPCGDILARLINVLAVIHSHVYFPTFSNGLKEIACYLGFKWTDRCASGIQSIVWRRRWEQTKGSQYKAKLVTYNLDDCLALQYVTQAIRALVRQSTDQKTPYRQGNEDVRYVEDIVPPVNRREWCEMDYALPEFKFINERAYFDYQRDRVYVRTSATLKKIHRRQSRGKQKPTARPNATLEMKLTTCPQCGCADLSHRQDGRLKRLVYDLRMRKTNIRRYVTKITTSWCYCQRCQKWFLPDEYLRVREYGHTLQSFAIYEHIAHRKPFRHIGETMLDCFDLNVRGEYVHGFKREMAQYYAETYTQILKRIIDGSLIHADETEMQVKKLGKTYVWVFTNLDEVVFMHRETREAQFLLDLLKDFQGVLVSDFYPGYEAIECKQQKCLIHLMRDFNQEIRANPWDGELKSLAEKFGQLLRLLVGAVDQHGLKAAHLGKHQKAIDRFFEEMACQSLQSEVAEALRLRFLKNREQLFTFVKHDGIPWNNNNAEHAIKHFAYYREYADGMVTDTGLKDYLVLLSIYLTCRYKGIRFLQFLRSRETDLETFSNRSHGRSTQPALDLFRPGERSSRWSRNRPIKRFEGGGPTVDRSV